MTSTPMYRWLVSEKTMRDAGYEWDCCGSCHNDDDWGYAMMPRQLGSGECEVDCCCTAPKLTREEADALLARQVLAYEEASK